MQVAPPHSPSRQSKRLIIDVADWLQRMTPRQNDSAARYAVTLTFDINKMHQRSWSGLLTNSEAVALAKEDFATFRRRLDRAILNNAAKRHGRELSYVPVIEGQGKGQRIHYHCVIVTPARIGLHEMTERVKQAWRRTYFGNLQVDVRRPSCNARCAGALGIAVPAAWEHPRDGVG